MPELPEVETMRRGLTPIIGGTVVGLEFPRCQLKPIRVTPAPATFRRRVTDRKIVCVDRVGKRVLVRLDSLDAIIFEPRMTGLVLLADPPDREHLRVELTLQGCPAGRLWFWDRRGLGSVRLMSQHQEQQELGPARLGPDALQVTAEQLRARLGSSRRAIKVALLDQRAVAGVGNLYASEILHLAGVHPEKQCNRITRAVWPRIGSALHAVLEEAIRYEGSTLGDGTYRNALNQSGSYQNHHRVYDRAGQPCHSCRHGQVLRIVQAQRSTFFCPRCQT
jgi:formamidopyrimidine-DNA glycosylase